MKSRNKKREPQPPYFKIIYDESHGRCKKCSCRRCLTEREAILRYLRWHDATGAMVCRALGISRRNFCWHKRELQKARLLWELIEGPCLVTGRKAMFLTTNPDGTEFPCFELSDMNGYPRIAGRDYNLMLDLENGEEN